MLVSGATTQASNFGPEHSRGVLYGILTGVCYSAYILAVQRAGKTTSSTLVVMGWSSVFAAFFLAILTFEIGRAHV